MDNIIYEIGNKNEKFKKLPQKVKEYSVQIGKEVLGKTLYLFMTEHTEAITKEYCSQFLSTSEGAEFEQLYYEQISVFENRIEQVYKNYIEFIEHVVEDFNIDSSKIHIINLLGDAHHYGKTHIAFEINNVRYVYKIKDIELEYSLYKIQEQINQEEGEEIFYIPKIQKKQNYSYMEYLQEDFITESHLFFYRYGALLAFSMIYQISDLHYENILSYKNYPVCIDFETAFSTSIGTQSLLQKHQRFLPHHTGLLPMTSPSEDISPLAPHSHIIYKKDFNYDETNILHYSEYKTNIENKIRNHVSEYTETEMIEQIQKGFEKVYIYFLRSKSKMDIILNELSDKKRRMILKHTYIYSKLLKESYHPSHFQSIVDRENYIEKQLLKMNGNKRNVIYEEEYKNILRGDIPYFSSKVGETMLLSDPNLNFESSLESMHRQIEILSMNQCKELRYLIEQSFLIDSRTREIIKDTSITTPNGMDKSYTQKLDALTGFIKFTTFDPTLYTGQTGMELYNFFKTGKVELFTREIKIFIKEALELRDEQSFKYLGGIYTGGLGGIAYYCACVLNYQEDQTCQEYFDKITEWYIENMNHQSYDYDFFDGLAGVLKVYTEVYKKKGKHKILIQKIIDILCSRYIHFEGKKVWPQTRVNSIPQIGVSHGNDGIAFALLAGSRAISYKEKEVESLVQSVYEYEDMVYSEKHQNWLDLRGNKKIEEYSLGYAHGASGICLFRHEVMKLGFNLPIKKVDYNSWIHEERISRSHTLSMGVLGNAMILYKISGIQYKIPEYGKYRLCGGLFLGEYAKRYAYEFLKGNVPDVLTLELDKA